VLPEIDVLLIGNLLHKVLEKIAGQAGVAVGGSVPTLAEALTEGKGVSVPWPEPEQIEAILGEQAAAVVREAGIALPGFARILAARTRPFLERVRDLDFTGGEVLPAVLGVEAEGSVAIHLEGVRTRTLRFRADRVDRSAGILRLTDYKAGKPISEAKRAATREARFLAEITAGRLLQVPAYAFETGSFEATSARATSSKATSSRATSSRAVGRYLFARPDLDDGAAVQETGSDDEVVRERFGRALQILLTVWESGSFFPRLLDPAGRKEPEQCGRCRVSQACLRGDSASRARLVRWLERRAARRGGAVHPAEEALHAAWGIEEVKQ
jgi:hypothetical protein